MARETEVHKGKTEATRILSTEKKSRKKTCKVSQKARKITEKCLECWRSVAEGDNRQFYWGWKKGARTISSCKRDLSRFFFLIYQR